MLLNSYLMVMLFSLLGLSLGIGIMSASWLGVWVALELNTLSFLGVICVQSLDNYEGGMMYFLVQSSGSFMFLFGSVSGEIMGGYKLWETLVLLALLLKLGVAPFHLWVPLVSGVISWEGNMMLLTLQKAIPLSMISSMYNMSHMLILSLVSITSCLIGGVSGWNELGLRKLLSFSSINHGGWMVACTMVGSHVLILYFLLYSMISVSVMYVINNSMMWSTTDLQCKGSWSERAMIYMMLVSLSGLPPLAGFVPKWFAIEALCRGGFHWLSVFMLACSLILLSFYLRLVISGLSLATKGVGSTSYTRGVLFIFTSFGWLGMMSFGYFTSSMQLFLPW